MAEKKQPRILIERTKRYSRVPKVYMNKECNPTLYKSFARYPVKNPHWQFETVEYQGHEFLLDSISEDAYDSQGRVIHCFSETEQELKETTKVYIPAANGKTIEVHAFSDGFVEIRTSGYDGNVGEDPYGYMIDKGRVIGFTYSELTEEQKRYMDIEDRLCFGEYESNMTKEEMEEANRFLAEGRRNQIIEQDEYGNPLKVIHWDCDEISDYITHEYLYDIKK